MTVVIKLGGGNDLDPAPLLAELATMDDWVLIHGGNAALDDTTRALGEEPEFLSSPSGHVSRRTTERTIELMQMVYRGRINNELVRALQKLGVRAVGLSGIDGNLLLAKRKAAVKAVIDGRTMVVRDDFTGRVVKVDPTLLRVLLDSGFAPVVTLPALAETGEAVNVDGDRAAAAIAAALGASALVNLSNVPGLLQEPDDPASLIRSIAASDLEQVGAAAKGRFMKKILAAREALDGGVPTIVLAAANVACPVASALAGKGTTIGEFQ